MITVKCQECSKEFEAQRTSAKFCSANCRVKFNSRVSAPIEEKKVDNVLVNNITNDILENNENYKSALVEPEIINKIVDKYSNPIDELGGYQKLDFEELKKQPIVEPNQTFDQLLKQFNNLVNLSEKPKDIKLKLEQIKESAKMSNLTPRQTDSITDRCNYALNGQYNTAKHNLKLS